jgi:branched-chain amino acid transport system substrate-binding protein
MREERQAQVNEARPRQSGNLRRNLGFLMIGLLLSLSLSSISCVQPFVTHRSSVNNHQPVSNIRIGILDALTGDDAESGEATVEAAKLAVQEVNAAGGLVLEGQRYAVELIIKDTQSKPETAVSAAQMLINQENVVALVGPQYSRYAIPVARLAEQAKIPMISPRSTNPETTKGKRFVFRANFVDTLQGRVVARFAHDDLKAQQAAVLYDIASPYNQGIADVFRQVFTDHRGTVVAFESYTTGERDFTPQLAKIRDRRPDVLFLPNYANEVPLQARQARQQGITATLLGADAWGGIKESDRADLEGAYFSDQYIPETSNKITQRFIQHYQQAYGHAPKATAAATYDSLGLLFNVIQNQGTIDPESIRQGIAEFGPYQGVTGRLNYQGTGDPIVSVSILQMKGNKAVFYKAINP